MNQSAFVSDRPRGRAPLTALLACAAAALTLLAGAAAAFPFTAAVNYGAGEDPASVAAADLDGDGSVDLIVANNDDDNVSVLLGNGDGTFDLQVAYAVGDNPSSVAVGDFNGDGDADIAVSNFRGDNVSVLLGAGDGGFAPAVNYLTGDGAIWVAIADLNGDGDLDLAVANSNVDEVSILLGVGDGTFGAADNYPAGVYPQSVTTGDFDGDGKTDLVVADGGDGSSGDGVSFLAGNGDGTFDSDVLFEAGLSPIAVTAADFDADGNLDVAVANGFGSTDISVLLGDGAGVFGAHLEYEAGNTPIAIAAADLNGDGDVDLAVANYFGDTDDVSVFLGNGDGTFQADVTYGADSGASAIAAALLNGDGAVDLVVANQFTANASVLLGTPSSGDSTPPTITITTPADGAAFELGQSVLADYACADNAGGSGVDTCAGPVLDGNAIYTGAVGSHTFTVEAADNDGNETSLSHTYTVGYRVLGRFPSAFSKESYVRGSTIPIKFRLGNAAGSRISDAEAQALVAPPCRIRIVVDDRTQPGCVRYDAATDVFQYDLKTSRSAEYGPHTVGLRITAPDGSVVNTDTATIVLR